jgi:hypothetical protein
VNMSVEQCHQISHNSQWTSCLSLSQFRPLRGSSFQSSGVTPCSSTWTLYALPPYSPSLSLSHQPCLSSLHTWVPLTLILYLLLAGHSTMPNLHHSAPNWAPSRKVQWPWVLEDYGWGWLKKFQFGSQAPQMVRAALELNVPVSGTPSSYFASLIFAHLSSLKL